MRREPDQRRLSSAVTPSGANPRGYLNGYLWRFFSVARSCETFPGRNNPAVIWREILGIFVLDALLGRVILGRK